MLDKENYEKLVDDVIKIADSVDFFRGVPYMELFVVLKDFDRHTLKKEDRVLSKDHNDQRISLIYTGTVGVFAEDKTIHTPMGIDIKSPALATLKKGDTLGQISALSHLPAPTLSKVTSETADIISFKIDLTKQKECPRAFSALYRNAFSRLAKGISIIAKEAKLKRRADDHAIETYLSNLY